MECINAALRQFVVSAYMLRTVLRGSGRKPGRKLCTTCMDGLIGWRSNALEE